MKAIINNAIGNTFSIIVDNSIYDIVFWKKASALIGCAPNIVSTKARAPCDIKINARKPLSNEKIEDLSSRAIDWIDKKRSIGDIISLGVDLSIIEITQFKYNAKTFGFDELENPKIAYIFNIQGFELVVSKPLFFHFASNPTIRGKRAI